MGGTQLTRWHRGNGGTPSPGCPRSPTLPCATLGITRTAAPDPIIATVLEAKVHKLIAIVRSCDDGRDREQRSPCSHHPAASPWPYTGCPQCRPALGTSIPHSPVPAACRRRLPTHTAHTCSTSPNQRCSQERCRAALLPSTKSGAAVHISHHDCSERVN